MADFVLRGLDETVKERLRARAARNRRSMNAELRELVSTVLDQPPAASRGELRKLAADIRRLSADRPQTPSEELLREAREER